VGSLGVVIIDKSIEASLLLQEVVGGWFGGLIFECQVHAFMAAILLGVSWLDPFDIDAKASPPDRELTQSVEGVTAGERNAIVGAYRCRQPEVLESPFKNSEGIHFLGGRKGVNGEQISAGVVGDGQGIAVLPIGEHELALVIGTPELVGFGDTFRTVMNVTFYAWQATNK
jgi:hypothetical protein